MKNKIASQFGLIFPLAVIAFFVVTGIFVIQWFSHYNENIAIEKFKQEQHIEYREIQNKFEDFFIDCYTNLRTISRLPSVKEIDRYAKNLNRNDRITIQENYNNLYNQTRISEVYIVSKDFNPDNIDPHTHKPEAPIASFDQLIIGRTADDYKKSKELNESSTSKIEEIEIEEYHLIKEQIAYFQKHYPTTDSINNLNTPAIIGREVITCDNSRYSPQKPDDKDRSGFVYSVPFYSTAGQFKGVVSAIFLTHVFRDFMGKKEVALINSSHKSIVYPHTITSQLKSFKKYIEQEKPDPELFYSEVTSVPTYTVGDSWKLWRGTNNAVFYESTTYKSIIHFRNLAYIFYSIFILFFISFIFLIRRNNHLKETSLRMAAEKLEKDSAAKSEFLSNMSHELRTPMHAILSYTNMGIAKIDVISANISPKKDSFLLSKNDSNKLLKFFTIIQISGERLLTLLNDILDLSELESEKMKMHKESTFFHRALTHSLIKIDPLLEEKKITIDIKYSEIKDKQRVNCDFQKLVQVLSNILSNAIKFSPEHSTIHIEYNLETKKSCQECIIRDEGVGIPPGEEKIIFDKFTQSSRTKTGAGGIGLGLAICKEIIEAHQGKIWAKNADTGKGAEFRVQLPLELDASSNNDKNGRVTE